MLAPTLSAQAFPAEAVTMLHLAGPLTTADHGAALRAAAAAVPDEHGVIIDVSEVALLSQIGLEALRDVAIAGADRGQHVVFVCTEMMMRSELILADLDTVAPVVHAHEQAFPLAGLAA